MERDRAGGWTDGSDWLAKRARTTPDRTALIDADADVTWTYRDLDDEVERTAGRLVAAGVDAGDHVGVLARPAPAVVRLVHAVARLGGTLVPLNVRLTAGELTAQVDRGDLDLLLCDTDAASATADAVSAADGSPSLLSLEASDGSPRVESEESLHAYDPTEIEPATIGPDHPWLLLFTSGTTGAAKPVVLTEENLRTSALASAFRLGIDPRDRWLAPLPLYHTGGLAPHLRSTLYGTAGVLVREFDAERTISVAREYGATGLSVIPTMLRQMLDVGDLPDLRFILCGGAPTPPELVERCADRSVPVCPTYGTTETASQVATVRPGEAGSHPTSVGQPLAWTQITIVDEDGTALPAGEVGELVIDAPTVTPGYYDDPDATAKAMGPYGLHTGDLARVDDAGRLYVLGRADDVIVTGGENVAPAEVERALRTHPEIVDASVVGLDDEQWGQRVAALVVAEGKLSPEVIVEHCREQIAGYKRPRTVAIVDDLPRTVSGTVDRAAARRLLDERGREV